jgi:ribonuclease HII
MTIILPTLCYENQFPGECVVGIDEAGCGPWAGPVVAGAVVFFAPEQIPEVLFPLIRDSKTLSKKQREKAFEYLTQGKEKFLFFAHGEASVEEIDRLNIARATHLAMERALINLPITVTQALVDGQRKPSLPCPVQMILKGDQKSLSIAAASIVAKVHRDWIMEKLHGEYPQYGWSTNAGYGTRAHQKALYEQGVTPHHRRSYAPIARLLEGQQGIKHD